MSSRNKKYYWLKLPDDFFQNPKIKKLRKIAGGDTYTIIYQKLMLLTLKTDGILQFENIEETFEEELSLILDEDVENIKVTVAYLLRQGLMEVAEVDNKDNTSFFMNQVPKLVGKESTSAARVRRHREKIKNMSKNIKALHCNADVTECNATVTSCNDDVISCNTSETNCNTEIEIEIEKEKKELLQEKKVTKTKKSGGGSKNEFSQTEINEWLKIKSKDKNNPSAYAAALKSKISNGEESVIEELKQWMQIFRKANKQSQYSQVLSETRKYIGYVLQTSEGEKTISSVEPTENDQIKVNYQDGNFSIIPNLDTFRQIAKRIKNVDRR